jgi:hypothetical protein
LTLSRFIRADPLLDPLNPRQRIPSDLLAWAIPARWVKSFDFLSAASISWPESGEPN